MIKKVSIVFSESRKVDQVVEKVIEEIRLSGGNLYSFNSVKDLQKKAVLKKISSADLILVIGGDGTMIGTIRALYNCNVPFLGINHGRVGFLTDINPENISSLADILKGRFIKEKRSIFNAGFSESNKDIFINEVVVHSGSITKMADLELSSNSQIVYKLRADGIIISSSTGSTAYSYSGGGPIISPKVKALSLLPMFSHSSSSHSLIVPDGNELIVKVKNNIENINIVVDGKKRLKYSKKGLKINNTKKYFHLYHPKDYNYFDACRSKLGWALPIEALKNI